MKGTCEELYKKGFLKEYHDYFQNKYYIACKKFLFFKIKYKVWRQEIVKFMGIQKDNYGETYVFKYVLNTNKNCAFEFCSGSSFCGRNYDLDLKKLNKIKCY